MRLTAEQVRKLSRLQRPVRLRVDGRTVVATPMRIEGGVLRKESGEKQ